MLRSLDIWRCALVKRPATELCQADLISENLVWLPHPTDKFAFRADPFGIWRDGKLHIFVEYFDYRNLKGQIELLVYDEKWNLLETQIVLSRPWHLSYPFVFTAGDDIWMLPESRRSGQLTLYRSASFPQLWEPFSTISPGGGGVDGTLLSHQGRWWLFYAIVRRGAAPINELHIASARTLEGPWASHPMNPVRTGLRCTRPAGRPIVRNDGWIDLPVQDGSVTYGGAIRRLRIGLLTEWAFEAEDSDWLRPSQAFHPFVDGIHTISAAGTVCLIDCKFIDRSLRGSLTWRRGRISERRRTNRFALPQA